MEPDVMVVSVRHIPFKEAEGILNRWNQKEQGYLFSIESPVKEVADYLTQKYISGRE